VEYDPLGQKCNEGLCAELKELKVRTDIKKLSFVDKCMEDDAKKVMLRWYEETANPWNLGKPNHTNV